MAFYLSFVKCDYSLVSIHNFASSTWANYADEYIIDITVKTGENDGIWCEPLKRGENYIYSQSDMVFVLDNCNMDCIENMEADLGIIIVSIDENKSFSNEKISISKSDDGTLEGFTKMWDDVDDNGDRFSSHYSYYSTNEESVRKIAKLFEIKL